MLVIKNVYKCSLDNPGEGIAFIQKVADDLKNVLDFGKAFISPIAKTITTEQDFTHPDYPHYNMVEVDEPEAVVPEEPEPSEEIPDQQSEAGE